MRGGGGEDFRFEKDGKDRMQQNLKRTPKAI